jgi:hypothetical protein
MAEMIVMAPKTITQSQVMPVVITRKLSVRAVSASTEDAAYSRTNGRPIKTPTQSHQEEAKIAQRLKPTLQHGVIDDEGSYGK